MSEELPGGLQIPLLLPEDPGARGHSTTMVVCGTMVFQAGWPSLGRLAAGWGTFGGRFLRVLSAETHN